MMYRQGKLDRQGEGIQVKLSPGNNLRLNVKSSRSTQRFRVNTGFKITSNFQFSISGGGKRLNATINKIIKEQEKTFVRLMLIVIILPWPVTSAFNSSRFKSFIK